MKKAEIIAKLEALPASELASLAGRSLGRGRPSKGLRANLVDKVLAGVANKQITVKRDGTIARKSK